jgi:hypothetical protein
MLCWLCIAAGAQGETFMAKVIAVPDGDTVTVLDPAAGHRRAGNQTAVGFRVARLADQTCVAQGSARDHAGGG